MIYVKSIDTRGLTKAMAIAQEWSGRAPEQAVCTAALFIMREVSRNTPRASLAEIDEGLAVEMIPVIGKRGKPLSTRYAKNRAYKGLTGPSYKPPIPFAWLIIGARARPDSRYNELTSNRFFIPGGHPFKGQPKSAFSSIMQGLIKKMVGARHSAIGFFASSTIPILTWLNSRVDPKYRRGSGVTDATAQRAYDHSSQDKGRATEERVGQNYYRGQFDMLIGAFGTDRRSESMNRNLHKIITPVLQRAIDQEAIKQLTYVAKKELQDRASSLRGCGAYLEVAA